MQATERKTATRQRGLEFSRTSKGVLVRVPYISSEYEYLDAIEEFEDALQRYSTLTTWTVVFPKLSGLTLSMASVLCHLRDELLEQGHELKIVGAN